MSSSSGLATLAGWQRYGGWQRYDCSDDVCIWQRFTSRCKSRQMSLMHLHMHHRPVPNPHHACSPSSDRVLTTRAIVGLALLITSVM